MNKHDTTLSYLHYTTSKLPPPLSYTYIFRKGRYQVPIFPRFWECSVFATSCSILYVHIPVMVLLEIHTDCQNVQRVMKIPREKEGGKTNIVCVYIYIWLPLGGEVAKEKKFFCFFRLIPSHSPPMYIASPWWQVAKGCQRMSRESWRSPGKRKEGKQT